MDAGLEQVIQEMQDEPRATQATHKEKGSPREGMPPQAKEDPLEVLQEAAREVDAEPTSDRDRIIAMIDEAVERFTQRQRDKLDARIESGEPMRQSDQEIDRILKESGVI